MSSNGITERDILTLLDVYKYRYLSASQICALHFPSIQVARRRLRALVAHKLVSHFTVPHTPERIYHLSKTGASVVAHRLGIEVADLAWSKNTHQPKDYYFMRHFLKTGDFRIALTKACAESKTDLLGFIPEFSGSKASSGRIRKYIRDVVTDVQFPSQKITHTPDAVFALRKENKPALFFLEIDRGTETLSNPTTGVYKMVRYYLSYAQSGRFNSFSEDFRCEPFKVFRTLIVTTSEKRVENMRQTMNAVPDSFSGTLPYLWVASTENVSQESIFDSVWKSLSPSDNSLHKIG